LAVNRGRLLSPARVKESRETIFITDPGKGYSWEEYREYIEGYIEGCIEGKCAGGRIEA
jgi:hypothetical protein